MEYVICVSVAAIVAVAVVLLHKRKQKTVKEESEVPQGLGLQVFNDAGEAILDTNDRITKMLGEIDINPSSSRSATSGIISANLGECDLWYIVTRVYLTGTPPTTRSYRVFLPTVTKQSNGSILWKYPDTTDEWDFKAGVHIIYGAY